MAETITFDSLSDLRAKIRLSTNTDLLEFKDLKYIPIDFESIMELLINRLKTRLPNRWTDFLDSNFGMEILEAVAYEASMLAYMINRYVNELYLPTAKTMEGVHREIKLVGYKPKGPRPSKTLMKFYIDSPHTSVITIPAYLSVGSGFYTINECRIEPGQTETTVYATAGNLVIDKFLTTGIVRDTYTLRESPVSYIEAVLVNDEPFYESDFIDDLSATKLYTVEYDHNYKATLSFGDGTYGENPKEGLAMLVYYNVNNGEDSNLPAFSINTINENIYDANGNIMDVKCINITTASGGKNPETPAQIKRNAPAFFRTQYRAVLRQDFKDIINVMGYDKVSVIDNSIDSNIGIFGVKIAALNSNNEILTDTEKEEIIAELNKRKIIATQFDIIKPRIVPINLTATLVINPSYNAEIVTAKTRKLLTEYLSLENRDFGDIVSTTDIHSIIKTIDGVSYMDQLRLEENRDIYVLEAAKAKNADGTSNKTLKIKDSGNYLTVGSYVSVLNDEDIVTLGKITAIDGTTYTLDQNLTTDVAAGTSVYPFFTLTSAVKADDKEIYVESAGPLGDLSNSVIVFADDAAETEHVVMYRSFTETGKTGEKLRLTAQVGTNYNEGAKLYIKRKNPLPILDGTHYIGSDNITFRTMPRFTPGAVLIPRRNVIYDIETRTLVRNSDTYDMLPTDTTISNIRRVYVTPTAPFKEGVQYTVKNNKSIVWLDTDAIPVNKQYFVDIIKVSSSEERTSNVEYYVNSINGYTAKITPSLMVELEDGEVMDVRSESINIYPLEIADLGTITLNVIQGS